MSNALITPVNLFMHTKINTNGSIAVEAPISKAGDKVVIKALLNITLGVTACSVSESKCNSGKCSPVKVMIDWSKSQFVGGVKQNSNKKSIS